MQEVRRSIKFASICKFTSFCIYLSCIFLNISSQAADFDQTPTEATSVLPYQDTFEISINSPEDQFRYEWITISSTPTLVKEDSDGYMSTGEYLSSKTILKSERVVQIRFSFIDPDELNSDYPYQELTIQLPLNQFSKEEAQEIHDKTNFVFDLTGQKSLSVKALAKKLIGYEVSKIQKHIWVQDLEKSKCSNVDFDDLSSEICKDKVYKEVIIPKKILHFFSKTKIAKANN